MRPGIYHEPSTFVRSRCTNLTVEKYPQVADGEVVIDGTRLLGGPWERKVDARGKVFFRSAAPYNSSVWQLFANDIPLTPARWPNTRAWSADWWSRSRGWSTQLEGTLCGHSIDGGTESGGERLADTNVSFDGCNAIVNNEHWACV